ncbi:MAG: enoyl-CoA hydratase/isomerase family protein [Alphaproteobacteria bacterium]
MDYGDYQHIRFERDGRILKVILNRPDLLNAVDERLHFELAHVFQDVAFDPNADVVILTGEGRAFCAGGDFSLMERTSSRTSTYGPGNVEGKRIVYSLLELEKPIICRMNGDAIGLGATIALLCDIIIADESARIADPHVRAGLVAGDGGALIWPQLIGHARAKEFLMLGTFLEAPRAAEMGLINYAVPAADLDKTVDDIAAKLANGATEAIAWTKAVANQSLKQQMHAIMDSGMAYEALSMHEDAHKDAVAKFLKKN